MQTTYCKYLLIIAFFSNSIFAQQSGEEMTAPEMTVEEQEYYDWANEIWGSIEKLSGEIALPGNAATLNVPDSFYYLNPSDAKKVMIEVWGNPPSQSESILGMLFPAESTPFDSGSLGVTIEYQQDGYVEDEEADTIDYAELLQQMQEDIELSSQQRVEAGYEPISLVGWAAQPYYDKAENKLHWAKEIKFGDQPENTLNYNIRVLGRKGVLVLNFIAGMEQLDTVNQNVAAVLNIAEFNQGSQYQDFDPEIDEVAAYGIGALVAGKVIAKTGLIAAAILFLKKFGIIIVLAIGAFARKMFSNRKKVQS
jgi:uncharacterized membrane-anchored protein